MYVSIYKYCYVSATELLAKDLRLTPEDPEEPVAQVCFRESHNKCDKQVKIISEGNVLGFVSNQNSSSFKQAPVRDAVPSSAAAPDQRSLQEVVLSIQTKERPASEYLSSIQGVKLSENSSELGRNFPRPRKATCARFSSRRLTGSLIECRPMSENFSYKVRNSLSCMSNNEEIGINMGKKYILGHQVRVRYEKCEENKGHLVSLA